MKYARTLAFLLATNLVFGSANGAAIAVGDNYADMISELGQPQGSVEMGDKTIYLYPAGSVTVEESSIIKVELKTSEEMARDVETKAETVRQWALHKAMMKDRHNSKGEALKSRAVSDPYFLTRSSGEQLAFWNQFSQDYPELDIADIVGPLTERYTAEQAEMAKMEKLQQQEQKIAKLEERVAEAEDAAKKPSYYAYYGNNAPYYYPYYQPTRVVVVNGNNVAVTPKKYGGYNVNTGGYRYNRYNQGGDLRVNGSVGSVNFRYSSGNNGTGPYYWNNRPQSSGITVIKTGGN